MELEAELVSEQIVVFLLFQSRLQRAAVLLLLLAVRAVARVEAQVLGVLALLDKAIRGALAQMELPHTHQAAEVALVLLVAMVLAQFLATEALARHLL